MAKALGEVEVRSNGKTYWLRLTMRGIAALQDEYGQDLSPILNLQDGQIPHFGVCLRVVELALLKNHPDAGPEIADDILSENMEIFVKVIEAAFPPVEADEKPGKKKAAA